MVTCIIQVGLGSGNWQKGEVTALMDSFLQDNLLELHQILTNKKYCINPDGSTAPTTWQDVGSYSVERAASDDMVERVERERRDRGLSEGASSTGGNESGLNRYAVLYAS